jgi:hypothetical protein
MVDAVVFICIVANEQATVDKLAASLLGVIGDIQGGQFVETRLLFLGRGATMHLIPNTMFGFTLDLANVICANTRVCNSCTNRCVGLFTNEHASRRIAPSLR